MAQTPEDTRDNFQQGFWLVGAGWLGSGIALGVTTLPFTFLLKESLHLLPSQVALFMTLANAPTYIKPILGIMSDSLPLFGTRRRHYLLLGCLLSALFFALVAIVPKTFSWLLGTYFCLIICLVLVSTVMGGLMVDVGQRHNANGRMTAQRVGINRSESLFSGIAGANLARYPLGWAFSIGVMLYLALTALYALFLKEPPNAARLSEVPREAMRQFRVMLKSRILWSAAGLVALVIAAPGFGTALLYYQTDHLKFDKLFLGWLALVGGVFGIIAAIAYARWCRRWNLRILLTTSIIVHAIGTLFYLGYRDRPSALIISAIEGFAQTMAILPLYDLSARATPKGSEAIAYSIMMSVWNLTSSLSNLFGSWLYDRFHLTIMQLVWLNAGSTALVLVAIPFLPAALMLRREGQPQIE